jgi:exodeoxyribonuclease V gamma subunit
MSLYVHRAERADRLAAGLAELLSIPLDDPFAAEIVSVPTRGVERWLAQGLSHRLGTGIGDDGVCAGVEFPSPRRLTARAMSGVWKLAPEEDPWQPAHAVWPLLDVIEVARGEEWLSVLWSYLGASPDRRSEDGGLTEVRSDRRWSIAHHLAGLFAGYASSRPTMVASWLRGYDTDGLGQRLPPDRAWQAELWRRLRVRIGVESPAERLPSGADELANSPGTTDLPSRVSVFGATRISADQLLILRALSHHRDVHLWLPHPSPTLWSSLAADPDTAVVGPRADRSTAVHARHPLLRSLGRDSRELQQMLAAGGQVADDAHFPAPEAVPATLLGWLQRDIANNCAPRPSDVPVLRTSDRSVQFHASHGPDRQVEVLRELLVGLLADDQSLEPRDILVLCPDIETYAPLISASFGLDVGESEAEHPGHRLRVRMADRSLRQLNPLLSALSRLLVLAESRMEASAFLDFCALGPVARKFGFSADDLQRLHELVPRSGVRWGFDAGHRERYGMSAFSQNTWAAGLDRLLLGVAMDESDDRFLGTALPLDDVDSQDVDLIGRLAECLDRVRSITDSFATRRPLASWCSTFREAIEELTSVLPTDSWQVAHAYGELSGLAEVASGTSPLDQDEAVDLSLAEVAAVLTEAFRGRASRANFRTGTLTMCTMLPMRSVPHRVVCLLGVDDGIFPRHLLHDGDDLLALHPWIGDRDPRSEDRQLLLDAIMAAIDHLVVVYAGMDPRTGARRPPAVPIGELLDALDRTARTVDGHPVRSKIMTEHALQPFDPRNFGRVATGSIPDTSPDPPRRPFSFDRASWRGALAASGERTPPRPVFSLEPLPEPALAPTVEIEDLSRFFAHPVRALLKERAGVRLRHDDDRPSEQIPITLAGLDRWEVGNRLLGRHLSGVDLGQLTAAEWRRGWLPPRSFGSVALGEVAETVRELAQAAAPYLTGPPERRDISVPVGPQLLVGTVSGIHETNVIHVAYSFLAAKHRLQSWIELLAVTASHPGPPWRAVTVGRGGRSVLGPVDPEWALSLLTRLAALRRTGLREPLPFSPKTSAEYARLRADGKTVDLYEKKLQAIWLTERDLAWESFFGTRANLEDLLAQPPSPEDEGEALKEPSRFGTVARVVFEPLLSVEASR